MIDLERTGRRLTFVLLALQGLFSASLIIVFTVSSIVAVELAGGDESWTGIPSTIVLISAAIFAPPIGRFMDKNGRRNGLVFSSTLGVLGALIAGWGYLQGALLIFLIGMAVLGLSRGGIELARYAAAEANPPAFRGRAISLVVLGGTFGSIAGPSLITLSNRLAGGFGLSDLSGPWFMSAFIALLGGVLVFGLLRPDPLQIGRQFEEAEHGDVVNEKPRSFMEVLADSRTKLAVGAMVFSQAAMVIVMTITPVHMHGHDHALGAISWVIMAHTLGMFGFSYFTGWLVDTIGRSRTVLMGGVILVISCVIAPFSTGMWWLIIALFLLGLGWNFAFVAGSTLLDDVLRHGEKGRIQGTVDALVKVASGVGSLSSGVLFAATGFALTSWLTVTIAVIPIIAVIIWSAAEVRATVGEAMG